MDITNIFFFPVCCFRRDLVSERLGLSIQKKNCHLFERLGLSVWKKLSSVRIAWAVHLKKVVICSNSSGYPFEKIVIRSNGSGYPFKKEFVDRSSDWRYLFKDKFFEFPSQNHFVTSHSRWTICYSPGHVRYEFCSQTYHIWIVTHLCSFVAIFAFILSIDYRQYRHTF